MKKHLKIFFRALVVVNILLLGTTLYGQEEESSKDLRPVRNMFESSWLLDNQSVLVPVKGTFGFDILHRFGVIDGYDNFFGLYAPSNIRLGFSYVPVDKLMVGFGLTKFNLTWDMNVKYAILEQARIGGSPISLTYYGNMAIDTRDKEKTPYLNDSDRFSYFHQLILARKVTDKFSLQVAGSLSHFNTVEAYINSDKEIEGIMKNDHVAVSVAGRYKVGPWLNIIGNYDQPITEHKRNNPNPNISFGIEMTSSSHQFQIFAGNYYNIIPQQNNVFNKNNFGDSEILIGFNIIRWWNL
ncbi:MAG: DUF5777 family beta-barrel protein [Saprospiraceae bacterium]|nr:DUF5777 family beta-barrel protein [Saprospiraceae bacterium]MCF8251969.1 DUF5777 family beta-barrel protein [Saprospiraceae bacterium]MCF8282778.1 DUF5777 family beta-barrel protein [Bacteroidales bacterium]MCF8313627.1 DUF5777 family beta-barrel protein [Saprospiraceae bacterium]MCF8442334.1 DUF5777 family beta-barrel protein [Saprospiraceae bacterium]